MTTGRPLLQKLQKKKNNKIKSPNNSKNTPYDNGKKKKIYVVLVVCIRTLKLTVLTHPKPELVCNAE